MIAPPNRRSGRPLRTASVMIVVDGQHVDTQPLGGCDPREIAAVVAASWLKDSDAKCVEVYCDGKRIAHYEKTETHDESQS